MGTIKDNKQRKMVDATRIKCGILGASRVKCPKGNSSFKVASTSFPFLRILWSQKWSPLFTMMLNKNFFCFSHSAVGALTIFGIHPFQC